MQSSAVRQRMFSWIVIGMILATIAITYAPVVAFDYAYADDYWVLGMRPLNYAVVYWGHNNNMDGRPLLNIWQLGVFGLCHGVQDLKYVRLLAVIGIFISACLFYKLIRRHLIEDRLDAALIASIFAINPCLLAIGAWAENGFSAYGWALGLLAIHLLLREEPSRPEEAAPLHGWKQPWGKIVPAFFILISSTFLYQPTTMIYWTGTAIWLIGRFNATRADWIKLARITVLFFVTIGIYYVICHTFWPPSGRFGVSTSVIRRAGWFVVKPLASTLSYPLLVPWAPWSIVALYLLSFGLWSYLRRAARTMWVPPLILALSPLTVLPTIIAAVHYDVLRTRGAIYGLIIVLWVIVLVEVVRRYGKDRFTLRHLLIPILLLSIVSGQYHIQRHMIMPQIWEESALLLRFQQYVQENPNLDRAFALRPPPTGLTGFIAGDEMGYPSLAHYWTSQFEFPIVLAGVVHRPVEDLPALKITQLKPDEPAPPDAFLVDLSQIGTPQ